MLQYPGQEIKRLSGSGGDPVNESPVMIPFNMIQLSRSKRWKNKLIPNIRSVYKAVYNPEAINSFRVISSGIVHQEQVILENSCFPHIVISKAQTRFSVLVPLVHGHLITVITTESLLHKKKAALSRRKMQPEKNRERCRYMGTINLLVSSFQTTTRYQIRTKAAISRRVPPYPMTSGR